MTTTTLDPFAPLNPPQGCEEILMVLRNAGRPITVRRITAEVALPTTVVRAAVRHLLRTEAIAGRDSGISTLVGLPEFKAELLARDPSPARWAA
jgi:hypothetical protein